MMKAYLSLGSNIGDRIAYLQCAIKLLKDYGDVVATSSFYETEAVGNTDQDHFINCCLILNTDLNPQDLLSSIQKIESDMGRIRREHWGPRIIDIDIIFYDDQIIDEPHVSIPHPFFSQRKFVLIPLIEIAPDFVDPQSKKSLEEMLSDCSDESIVVKLKKS